MSKKNDDFFHEKKPWSEIKDQLLGCYLAPYFSKILATKRPVFYVDAFAGKGMFDDGKPGSPIIALDIINDSLLKTNFNQYGIQSCFIELNHADDLAENLKSYKDKVIISGKYEENIEQQLQGKDKQNVFIYIDPYGIKSLHYSIFNKLSKKNFYSIELLINFNSFGFVREACHALSADFNIDLDDIIEVGDNGNIMGSIDDLNRIAGGDYWVDIIEEYKKGYYDGYEAERRFADKYCEELRNQYVYVLNMPIRLRRGQRPKYRMIHVTNHAQGCVLMNDNMCKRWEALQEMQNDRQLFMFEEDVENNTINKEQIQKELGRV